MPFFVHAVSTKAESVTFGPLTVTTGIECFFVMVTGHGLTLTLPVPPQSSAPGFACENIASPFEGFPVCGICCPSHPANTMTRSTPASVSIDERKFDIPFLLQFHGSRSTEVPALQRASRQSFYGTAKKLPQRD